MMQDFEHAGVWWLPGQSGNTPAGTLTYSEQDGLQLDLIGALFEGEGLAEAGKNIPVLQGAISGKYVTLTDCIVSHNHQSGPEFTQRKIRVSFAYIGHDLFSTHDKIKFDSIEQLLTLDK